MANNCWYDIKVRGARENCEKFVKKMRSYDEENHFYRIFSCEVCETGGTDNDYYIWMSGDCAWSLETCCRASGYSEGFDLFALNTKRLHLKMEAYSQETGIGFQEHYLYDNGECVCDECEDFEEYIWDRSVPFDKFKEEYYPDDDVKEEDFDSEGVYVLGGFGDWSFSI